MTVDLRLIDHQFLATTWRRKSRLWRRAFDPVGLNMTRQRMETVVARAKAVVGSELHASQDTDFLEHAERYDSQWQHLSQALSACTRRELRIDVTITRRASGGIGAHFDDSDNFVFQVDGRKVWRIHSPDILDPQVIHARLIKLRGVGRCNIPEDTCEEYVLEPGDVLYLPFLWPHWGLSDGPSTSVSAVIPALTPLGAIALLQEQIRREPAKFSPLEEEDELAEDLLMRVRQSLTTSRPIETLRLESHVELNVTEAVDAPALPAPAKPHVVTNSALPLDMTRVRSLVEQWVRPVPFGNLVLPNNIATADLQSSFAAYMLKRSGQVLVRASHRVTSEQARSHLETFARILSEESASVLGALLACPLYTGVVHKLKYLLDLDDIAGVHAAIRALGTCFLDVLVAGCNRSVFRLPILPEPDGFLQLPLTGYRLSLNASATCAQYNAGASIDFENAHGQLVENSPLPMRQCGSACAPLARIGDGAPTVIIGDAILSAYYPRDRASRANVLDNALAGDALRRYLHTLSDAWSVLRSIDSAGADEIGRLVTLIAPVHDNQGLHPNNQSMHAFRGLVAMSARPTYMSVQVLMHESGHNKFSTLLDLCQLHDPERTAPTLYSPFTRCERPVNGLLHGLFAFARDLEITRKMIGRVAEIENYPMARYYEKNLSRWKTSHTTVLRHVKLTESGQKLMEEFDQVALMLESPLP